MHRHFHDLVSIYSVYVLLSGVAGCASESNTVGARYESCAEQVADKDLQVSSLGCFTPKSRYILEGIIREEATSRRMLKALVSYQDLLKYTEVMGPAEISGSTALLRVRKGRQVFTVVLERDSGDGEWRIDATELPQFWQKLHRASRGG